jgi:hypothetical protein
MLSRLYRKVKTFRSDLPTYLPIQATPQLPNIFLSDFSAKATAKEYKHNMREI